MCQSKLKNSTVCVCVCVLGVALVCCLTDRTGAGEGCVCACSHVHSLMGKTLDISFTECRLEVSLISSNTHVCVSERERREMF